jgi:hypothetical protein
MTDMIQIETGSGTVYAPSWDALASLFKKMATVMGSTGAVKESGQNTTDRYKYADADDVLAPVQKAMAKANIGHVMQIVDVTQTDQPRASGGMPGLRTVLNANAIFGDGDTGAFIVSSWKSEAADFGMRDKGINKCVTTAQKFFMKRAFLLVSKDDIENDPDSKSEPDGDALPTWKDDKSGKRDDKSGEKDSKLDLSPLQPIVDNLNASFAADFNVAQVYLGVCGDEPTTDLKSLKIPIIRWYIAEAVDSVAERNAAMLYNLEEVLAFVDEKVTDKTLGGMKLRYDAIREYFGEE